MAQLAFPLEAAPPAVAKPKHGVCVHCLAETMSWVVRVRIERGVILEDFRGCVPCATKALRGRR